MKKLSSELSSLTGFPKLPHWLLKIFLRFPFLVPVSIKWRISNKGIGLLVSQFTKNNESGSSGNIIKSCKELGFKQGNKVRAEFDVKNDDFNKTLKVIIFTNRLFGINSKLIDKKNGIAKTRTNKCSFSGNHWSSKPCGALSAWEIGLVEGLNPNIKVKILKRMTRGDDYCETKYELEEIKRTKKSNF